MSASAIAVLLYLAALIWVVLRGRKLAVTGDMFNVFGHRAGFWRASSGYLSLIGAGELVTISQLGYDSGIGLLWFPGGIAAGFVILGTLGDNVRTRAKSLGANTLVGYVTHVFGRPSGIALSIVFVVALGALLTIQFILGGQLLALTTGLPPSYTSAILAVVIVIYLSIGGYVAVLSTDVLRMIFLALVATSFCISAIIGNTSFAIFDPKLFPPMPINDGLTIFVLGLFGAVCAGDVWQTVIASESKKVLRDSMFLAALVFVVLGLLIGLLGMAAKPVVTVLPDGISALVAAIQSVVSPTLSPLIALMIVGSVMATADTEIWVVSTTLVSLFRPTPARQEGKQAFQNTTREMTKFVIPAVTLTALALSYLSRDAQSMYGGLLVLLTAIAPAIIAVLFNIKRPNAVAASLWFAVIVFIILSAVYRLAIPSSLTFLPVICSLIGLVIGLIVDEIRNRKISV